MEPTAEEIQQGLAIAKANASKALELPELKVVDVRIPEYGGYPFQYNVIFDDGRSWPILVVDGKVVEKRSNKTIGAYFKKIDLLSRRNWPFEVILGVIQMWGEGPPPAQFVLTRDGVGPGPNDKPKITWTENTATLTVYTRYEAPSFGGPRAYVSYLRATMKITPVYDLEWKVERCDHVEGQPDAWKPFSG